MFVRNVCDDDDDENVDKYDKFQLTTGAEEKKLRKNDFF